MIKKISIILLLILPISLFAWKMESGTVQLNDTTASSTWTSVILQQTYDTTPLIFAIPDEGSGYNTDDPAALRIQNIGTSSFEILQVEPNNQDGPHTAMTIHYIAIEPGEYTLNGAKIIASTISTQKVQANIGGVTKGWENVTFPTASFASAPVVLGMIQGLANENNNIPNAASSVWLTVAMDAVTGNDFNVALERAEVNDGSSITNNETIAYLAMDSSIQGSLLDTQCNSIHYETIAATGIKGWTNGCYKKSFINTYATSPNVIGKQTTRNGGNGGWLRRCSLSVSDVGLTIEEDIYKDTERKHVAEDAGLIVFEKDFVYDSTFNSLGCNLSAEYRMDECYWLGSGTFDLKDSVNGNNAETYNNAKPNFNDGIINFSGEFNATGYFQPETSIPLNSEWTYSLWMNFPLDTTGHQDFSSSSFGFDYYFASASLVGTGDLPSFTLQGTDLQWAVYDEKGGFTKQDIDDTYNTSGWRMITFVKKSDDSTDLYIDGSYVDTIALGTDGDLGYLLTSSDGVSEQTLSTQVDEVKLWTRALTANDISAIYNKEQAHLPFDGSARDPITCSASIAANTWEMIGIPVDPRAGAIGVQDIFGDDFDGSKYDNRADGWILFKKVYSDINNSAHYEKVDYANNETIDFGRGYWLKSTSDANWDVEGLPAVNYDSTYNETTYCTAARCVEVDLNATSSDGSDGTGIRRFNLNGFVGVKPVEWADCRFIISDMDGSNVEVLTPEEADTAGYASRTISLWSGGQGSGSSGQVVSSDYTECTDTTPGGCTLQPFHGVWIELLANTTGKKVKLLLPEE